MNDHARLTTKTGRKMLPSAALALAVGLTLASAGTAVLATPNLIPGVEILYTKNLGPSSVVVPDPSGNFSLRLTERGNYTISTVCRLPGGCLPHKLSGTTLKPGAEGDGPGIIAILIGLLLPAQKASAANMTFDFTVGERGVVLNGQFQDAAGVRIVPADVSGDGVQARTAASTKSTGETPHKVAENESPRPTARGHISGSSTAAPDSSQQSPEGPAPRAVGGDAKRPGELRVINNSETDTATVEGIGGQGGGRYTFKPTLRPSSPGTGSAAVESSNRDHIDQDAQDDIKKRTAVRTGDPSAGVVPAPSQPIANLEVKLGKNPGGSDVPTASISQSGVVIAAEIVASSRTDSQGNFHFDKLPAGIYELSLPGLPSKSITVGAHGVLNGKALRRSDGTIDVWDDTDIVHVTTAKGGNEEIKPGISDQAAAGGLIAYSAAPRPESGVGKLPGLAGDPIAGVKVRLGKNPGGSNVPNATISQSGGTLAMEIVASSKTDSQGNFHFDKLPAGIYELSLPGLPSRSLLVGADGVAAGKVMRGSDGSMSIFDRWGVAASQTGAIVKRVFPKVEIPEEPVGFGSGNTLGAGPGMGGPMLPGAGPGLGPMGPGAGPGMGGPMGPGGAMGGRR